MSKKVYGLSAEYIKFIMYTIYFSCLKALLQIWNFFKKGYKQDILFVK